MKYVTKAFMFLALVAVSACGSPEPKPQPTEENTVMTDEDKQIEIRPETIYRVRIVDH